MTALQQGYFLATQLRDHELALVAAMWLAEIEGAQRQRPEFAQLWTAQAEALLARDPARYPELAADLADTSSWNAYLANDLETARREAERGLAAAQHVTQHNIVGEREGHAEKADEDVRLHRSVDAGSASRNHMPADTKRRASSSSASPDSTASARARQKMTCSSVRSPRPKAWATRPVVPERRKLKVVKTTSKTIAPAASRASIASSVSVSPARLAEAASASSATASSFASARMRW